MQQLQKLATQLQSLQHSVQQLQQGLRSEQQRSSSLKARVIAKEQNYVALEQTLTNEQQKSGEKIAKLENKLNAEQERSSTLEARLTDEEQKSAMLEKGLTTEQQKSSALETKCESLESALAVEKQTSQLLDAKCRSQEERLKTVEDTVERLWTISRDEINFSNKIIGTGGWGYVTEATFRGRQVAAKCLHEAIISPHNQELFAKEMKMFARCRHKNLIEFIGAVPDHPAVIVTEMMDCTLRFALSNARVIPNHIHPICIDVAQGLDYLHGIQPHPLIHRDVSAPNVLLKVIGTGWIAKLSDLGSAQFANIAKTLAPGCVLYASPEVQQRDTAVKQTEKIDVYSYGVLLIEILTKEMPTGTLTQLIDSLQPTRPQFIPLIQHCTNADPIMRPTMREVISLLDTINI